MKPGWLSDLFRGARPALYLLHVCMLAACTTGVASEEAVADGKRREWVRAVEGITSNETLTRCFAGTMGAAILDAGIIQLYPDADAVPGAYIAMRRAAGTLRARPVSIRLDAGEPFALLRTSGVTYDVMVPHSGPHHLASRIACDELVARSQTALIRLNDLEKGKQ